MENSKRNVPLIPVDRADKYRATSLNEGHDPSNYGVAVHENVTAPSAEVDSHDSVLSTNDAEADWGSVSDTSESAHYIRSRICCHSP
jgi:hypothetical protein